MKELIQNAIQVNLRPRRGRIIAATTKKPSSFKPPKTPSTKAPSKPNPKINIAKLQRPRKSIVEQLEQLFQALRFLTSEM